MLTRLTSYLVRMLDGRSLQDVAGEFDSVAAMRTGAKVSSHGQKVKLKCWDSSLSTSYFTFDFVYDSTDTTSVDDGYRTVVTSDGKRLKAILDDGIDLRLAGLRANGDNLGTSFNRVYAAELAKVLTSGRALKFPTIKLPSLNQFGDPNTSQYNAKLNQSIKMPSFVPVNVVGDYVVEFTPTDAPAIWITNQIAGVVPGLVPWRDMNGKSLFKNDSGKFRLVGPGATVSQSSAMKIGNTINGSTIMDLRDMAVHDFGARGFRSGMDFDFHDTYILDFYRMELTGNYWGISAQVAGKANAGERITYHETLIADSTSHHIFWNTPGIGLTFKTPSLDYTGGSVIYLDNGARGCAVKVEGGHIEGFGGMLILQVAQGVAWYGEKNRVYISEETEIKAAGGTPGAWASRRKILHSGVCLPGLGTKAVIKAPIYWPAAPSEPHLALMGYTDTTPLYMECIYESPSSPYPDCLVSYRQSSNKGLYRFNTEGTGSILSTPANPTLADATSGYSFSTNGSPTVTYGSVDADGFMHVIVDLDSPTTWVEISNKGLYYSLSRGAELNTGISVMMESLTGTLLLNTRMRYFYGTSRTADGYEDGDSFNCTELLSATYEGNPTPLTTSKYVGVQSAMRYVRQDSVHPKDIELVQPGIVLRGSTGRLRVKLPVIWHSRGKGTYSLV